MRAREMRFVTFFAGSLGAAAHTLQGLLLEIVYIIMITIPYAIVSRGVHFNETKAGVLLQKLEKYTHIKPPMQSMFDPFAGNETPYKDANCQGQHVRFNPLGSYDQFADPRYRWCGSCI
jgi:hypothetical protein